MIRKYYFELINKITGDYILQSKYFKTTEALEKWLARNIDFIDFNTCKGYIMIADYKNDCWEINKSYSYIDKEIFLNLKETKGE